MSDIETTRLVEDLTWADPYECPQDCADLCVKAAAEIERLKGENDTLRSALRVNALRWQTGVSHEEIDVWIDGITKPINETPCEPTENK